MDSVNIMEEEAVEPVDAEGVIGGSTTAPQKSPFHVDFEDQKIIDPKIKFCLIITCYIAGLVLNFRLESLQEETLFSKQNFHYIKPTKAIVKLELQ